jgi:hypothetical protein
MVIHVVAVDIPVFDCERHAAKFRQVASEVVELRALVCLGRANARLGSEFGNR